MAGWIGTIDIKLTHVDAWMHTYTCCMYISHIDKDIYMYRCTQTQTDTVMTRQNHAVDSIQRSTRP